MEHTTFTLPVRAEALLEQGFPILIHRTSTSEHQRHSLVNMGVKIAHLPGDIVNANPIQQAQDRTIELRQETENRSSACLAGIFS